jgi:RNA polymerase sigma factor (sigma-70 family)
MPAIHTNLEATRDSTPVSRGDEELVRGSLDGDHEAWSQLIDKYKNLIFSVPIKYGFSRDDAADIFQDVCLTMLAELKTLRDPRALPKWLLMVTSRRCFNWKRRSDRIVDMEPDALELAAGEIPPEGLAIIVEAEREQSVREAVSNMPTRCRRLIAMLFFDQPPRPYRDVAQSLGIATGSIGFIRQRCLDRLRKRIESLQNR